MEGIYRFADVVVRISHQYNYFHHLARNYEAEGPIEEELFISREDILREAEIDKSNLVEGDAMWEACAIHRKLCECLIRHDAFLIHASAIAKDGRAFLFLAPSGTGKSTHTRLWRKVYGEEVFMINDDKPLIRFLGDEIMVYGAPWRGKHSIGCNATVPIGGICFLDRGENNQIRRIAVADGFVGLLGCVYRPEAFDGAKRILELTMELAKRVPMWKMECNMEPEAARMACEAMTNCKNEA